jgi:hypothetical protein
LNEEYRSFSINGGASPIETTLLGCITEWCPRGAIDYRCRDRSLVELTRVPAFPLDDEPTAECFGLEIARLLVDSCYRELVIERYEMEKRYIQQRAGSPVAVLYGALFD